MKKIFGIATTLLLTAALAACGTGSNSGSSDSSATEGESTKLVIGASVTPHAEILEQAKPLLAEEGIDLEIKTFDDYVLPNKALENGDIDANYFQHIPYLNKQIADNGYDFVNAGAIHIEPMGLYSKRISDISELEDGATVLTSTSESDWGRILTILQDADLITLKDGVDTETATFDDIAENPKNLEFKHDVDPSLLATAYQNDEADLIAINANFAFGIDLNPADDSVLLEADNSPYVNVIAVRSGDEDSDKIKKLIEVLHSDEIKDFVEEQWQGSVKIVDADAK
ncbi:MetQ/NlpA family ABC transporter substrate-binding protein [Enterococcus casseliflavus]|uniref:MetQ/NlpA family ABC transporter substrate-binding protein n=1 Tax=Enterococcus casseliflavus TaxID=37734 RepID=UPI00232F89DA|nr:MetQ/NlpA family ABC transporter substrate-binding protein [Enterococcus casseliflavus]MDB1695326.1 MetQ/NlpA family ABC transporter substrate-binding protein [Enterococcus casseliflavus]MDB1698404.1 MetQ/NlpA family ABC transporter substrate-binding protein [Enterococcus casseliflavus]MDB1700450.1 MetQ/NlpA family ABC transporter substrate-binding protein [Enterococcus casseliflavus]MDB1705465.1 MetQ/NlpA family ABC transporter substrate-binding protein [Enterococcus casseliflavus]